MLAKMMFGQLLKDDRGGDRMLSVLIAVLVLVPILNLLVPESSVFHLSKSVCLANATRSEAVYLLLPGSKRPHGKAFKEVSREFPLTACTLAGKVALEASESTLMRPRCTSMPLRLLLLPHANPSVGIDHRTAGERGLLVVSDGNRSSGLFGHLFGLLHTLLERRVIRRA